MSRLQVASHLISGLSAAVEGCARALSAFYGTHSVGPPSRVAVAKAAYNVSPTSRNPDPWRACVFRECISGSPPYSISDDCSLATVRSLSIQKIDK